MPPSLVSFAFRLRDLLPPAILLALAAAGVVWNESQGKPLTVIPFLGLGIGLASTLINAYFLARQNRRDIEYNAWLRAQPLIELKVQLIHELSSGKSRLDDLRTEIEKLEIQKAIASQLSSLDKESIQALLKTIDRSNRHGIWIERGSSFVSGILASLVASVLYKLANL